MFRTIARYSASLYAATLLSSGLSFVVTMVIARRVPKEALGLYGFYVTLYSFAGMLLMSGLNQSLVKFLADPREDRGAIVRLTLTACAALAAASWPLAALAWAVAPSPAWPAALVVLPFFVLLGFGNSVFRSELARGREVAAVCGVSATNSLATLGFVFLGPRPETGPIAGDLLSYVVPGLLVAAVLARRARRPATGDADGPRGRGSAGEPPRVLARRLLVFAWPLTVAGVAFAAYTNAATLLVRALVGLAALGEYVFALQLLYLIDKPLQILARVVLAGFSAQPKAEPEDYHRLLTFNLAFFPPLAAAVVYLCPFLLRAADLLLVPTGGEALSARYASAPFFVALFALAVPARCVEFLVSSLAIARGRPEVSRHTHVWTAVLALPLLTVLVALGGARGAALMPVFHMAIFLTVQGRRLRADLPAIVSTTGRSAAAGTLLLAGALAPAALGLGALWMPPAVAAYVLGGHALGAWDLRLLVPKGAIRPSPSAPPPPAPTASAASRRTPAPGESAG